MDKQKVVGIKFEGVNYGKIYSFDPNNLKLKLEDRVVVDTSHGLSMGIVAAEETYIDESKLVEPLKKVVRIATKRDLEILANLKKKEQFALKEAKKLSKKLKLEMHFVDSEYTYDESKVIITFTSDERVDFRELVKTLAGILKTRIELRQVGIRDEAKILGGIGPCGKEVCCKQFLTDFEKVNIKMAKNQGISLNPNNINGVCGRLKCCFAYENSQYMDLINKMPRLNSTVKTKDGVGTVMYNSLLKEVVSVKVKKQDDTYEINDYPLSEIEFSNEEKRSGNN